MQSLIQSNSVGRQGLDFQALPGTQETPTLESPRAQKLRKSTEEFESFLVTSWWEKMEKSFGDTQKHPPGFETLNNMGLHAVTLAMAKAGGLGIARMLYHKLAPALEHAPATVSENH
jgi:hypothetical protein